MTGTTPEGKRGAERTGRLLVLTAAVMWSASGLFAKAPILADWPLDRRGPMLAFWRALFGGLVLVPFVRRPRWTWRLVPAMLCFAAMNLSFLQAMTWTTEANAVWLQYTAPFWVFLVGVFWLGETAQRRDVWMLVWGMLGVAVILFFELQIAAREGGHVVGVVWGLASGITFALVIVTARGLRDVNAAWVMTLNHLATAIILGPYVAVTGLRPTAPQLGWMAAFGMLQMGLPYVLFTRGLRHIRAHEASGIALLEPLLVPLWVFLVWHNSRTYQPPDWWTLAGGALILVGLVLRYRRGEPG